MTEALPLEPRSAATMVRRPFSRPPPLRTLARRLGDLLSAPIARVLVPLAGMLLTLPSVTSGLAFEDALLRLKARGALGSSLATRLDLFSFWPANPALRARLTETGIFPWFAAPNLQIEFLRPLSAALHIADFVLFDRWPWLMHLESIALYAGVIALAAAIYRRLLPTSIAMLAALFYALDYGHGIPVGWLANRNALVAAAFGFGAILAHDRWRREGWRAGQFIGPIAFAFALLGGESGLGAIAYLVAHAMTLDPAPRTRRALALAPYGIVLSGWMLAYRWLGYGTRGSGFYLDPMFNPAAFLRALPGRAVALILGQFALPPSALYNLLPDAGKGALVLAGAAFAAYVVRAIGPRLRAAPTTRFFALGMLLSLIPIAATFPDNRLLLFAGLGGTGIVASVVGDLREPPPADAPHALRRWWIALHLVLSPLLLPVTSVAMPLLARMNEPPARRAQASQTVVIVNAPMVAYAEVPWLYPLDPDRPVPQRVRVLAGAIGRVVLTREGSRTIVVERAPGTHVDPMSALFRDEARPIHEADTFALPGMRAEVLRLDANGAPASVRFQFDRDLDDGSFRWVAWNGRFTDVALPGIGARVAYGD